MIGVAGAAARELRKAPPSWDAPQRPRRVPALTPKKPDALDEFLARRTRTEQ